MFASCFLVLVIVLSVIACAVDVGGNGSAVSYESTASVGGSNGAVGSETGSDVVLSSSDGSALIYVLPSPVVDGDVSVEAALTGRRSHRSYQDMVLTLEQVSQILWSAYGVTLPSGSAAQRGGLRTAPSAGALYPLEIYAIIGNVEGVDPGVYRYNSGEHTLEQVIAGDVRDAVREAALNQGMVSQAPMSVFFSAVFSRTTERYGERGVSYIYIEVGHSAQNVYLQAEAMGLGTCAIGAFTDDTIRRVLGLADDEEPLYLMPVGYVNS